MPALPFSELCDSLVRKAQPGLLENEQPHRERNPVIPAVQAITTEAPGVGLDQLDQAALSLSFLCFPAPHLQLTAARMTPVRPAEGLRD